MADRHEIHKISRVRSVGGEPSSEAAAPLHGPAAGPVQRLAVSLRTVKRTGSFNGGGRGVLSQAGPTRPATISAESATSGRPPPGCEDPPTRNNPGTGEALAGRRNAARAPLLDVP
jgi:hypothetical protein